MNSSSVGCRFVFVVTVILSVGIIQPLMAQDSTRTTNSKFKIRQGTVLAGFSVQGVADNHRHYYYRDESLFSRLRSEVQALYFVSDRIAVGPVAGIEYWFRDGGRASSLSELAKRWHWGLAYGAQAAVYFPMKKLGLVGDLGLRGLVDSYLFVNGRVNGLWTREPSGDSASREPVNRFGYRLGAGALVPLTSKVGLEFELGWQVRRRDYRITTTGGGQITKTYGRPSWLNEFLVGFGIKVML